MAVFKVIIVQFLESVGKKLVKITQFYRHFYKNLPRDLLNKIEFFIFKTIPKISRGKKYFFYNFQLPLRKADFQIF